MSKTERQTKPLRRTNGTVDKRGVRYAVPESEPILTTQEISKTLNLHQETVWRWCRRWFGQLPKGRTGRDMGYRIPPIYMKVARVWSRTQDETTREVARKALVDDGEGKNFVVVVGNVGSTHYTGEQVVERLSSILTTVSPSSIGSLHVFYVGDA